MSSDFLYLLLWIQGHIVIHHSSICRRRDPLRSIFQYLHTFSNVLYFEKLLCYNVNFFFDFLLKV